MSAPLQPIGRAHGPLAGRHVRLRPLTEADVGALTILFADPTVRAWWVTDDPAGDAREHAAACDPELAVWAIEAEVAVAPQERAGAHAGHPHGRIVVGLIQAHEEADPTYRYAGIDIALAATAQGRGFGPDAIRAVAIWLIEVRGHHRLVIDPAAANERAIRAYASVGFRPVGTMRAYERGPDGTFHDGLLMELLAGELT